MLERGTGLLGLNDWGTQLLRECEPIAEALDAQGGGRQHRDALLSAWKVIDNADTAPSARVLTAMASDFDSSFIGFTRAQSLQTQAGLLALPYSDQTQNRFAKMTQVSLEEQRQIEAADSLPFEIYREQYLSAERLGIPGQRVAA
jgi:glutamate--cysteine ligase